MQRSCLSRIVDIFHCVLLLSAVPTCGYPRPADVEDEGESKYQLLAIEPDVASAGTTLTIEGTFDSTVMVNFAGGTSVPATVLGRHRATVTVPETAIPGALSITTRATTVGSIAFRPVAFATGLQPFQVFHDQGSGARQETVLSAPRSGASIVVVSNYIYVIGGYDGNGYLRSVERASINADGSLGPFTLADVNLVMPRAGHTSLLVGVFVYVIGGSGNFGVLNSIERAMIGPDGSLGPFSPISDVALAVARSGSTTLIVGNNVYVIGGTGNGVLNSIEKSVIGADGSLSSFALISSAALTIARTGHTAAVIGNVLYVIGGVSSTGVIDNTEGAVITGDGSLLSFVPISNARLTAARANHTSVMLGDTLYILGGTGAGGDLMSIERAAVHSDGSIDAFSPIPNSTIGRRRNGHVSAVLRNHVYIIGGSSSGAYLGNIEYSSMNVSGVFGSFLTVRNASLIESSRYVNGAFSIGSSLYVLAGGVIGKALIQDDDSIGTFLPLPNTMLNSAYSGYATALIGRRLYAIGGVEGSVAADTVGRQLKEATINADGTLSPFLPVSGVTLRNARSLAKSIVIRNRLYVIGGRNSVGNFENSIEMALINPDGSLGDFMILGVTAGNGRQGSAGIIVGKFLYLIGGVGSGSTIERAIVNDDGSLGEFMLVPGITLATLRYQHAAVVIGPYLYVIGGYTLGSQNQNNIERAIINADGSLGPFSAVPTNLTPIRWGLSAMLIGNQLYVPGGTINDVTFTTDIEGAMLR